MNSTVNLPVWLVIIGGFFAAWALLNRLLVPGIRWYLRRRANLFIARINKKLDLKLPAFKTTRRKVLIDRLRYDTEVIEAIRQHSHDNNIPHEVVQKKVERYAREIVPAFSVFLYFRFGSWLSRSVARVLFRIRVGFSDANEIQNIDPQSSVVFIMNHRSNVDYILLGYFALQKVVMSFAVGEWARFWPVQQLIRSMGAFFVRRGSKDTLYRKVLSRYVRMATEAGVVQAIFPEGKLSMDGGLNPPKIGLLDYMLRDFNPQKERDIVFIPVGVNYDRVLEDRSQLLRADPKCSRKSGLTVFKTTTSFLFRNFWLMLRGRWHRFGYAVVNFGPPLSMKKYFVEHQMDFKGLDRETRIEEVLKLGKEMMEKVSRVIPVVPVSLLSTVFMRDPDRALSDLEIKAAVQVLIKELEDRDAHIYIPRKDRDYAIEVGLRMLKLRHLIREEDDLFRAVPEEMGLLSYYANSISHFWE
ncbi:1-acyl-sn-glycerol-3-phosphate acyltransferase [Acidobacteriota bacterium]